MRTVLASWDALGCAPALTSPSPVPASRRVVALFSMPRTVYVRPSVLWKALSKLHIFFVRANESPSPVLHLRFVRSFVRLFVYSKVLSLSLPNVDQNSGVRCNPDYHTNTQMGRSSRTPTCFIYGRTIIGSTHTYCKFTIGSLHRTTVPCVCAKNETYHYPVWYID